MSETVVTRASLLMRVRECGDHQAWREFVELYGPLIYQFARKRGLQDADAADVTQIVLQAVAGEIRRFHYQAHRGSFRKWLFAVVRNQLNNYVHRQQGRWRGSGDSSVQNLLENQPERDSAEERLWEEEHERRLFLWATDRVRGHFHESSWSAFWQTAVEGKHASEVAKALGMTVGGVYTAKSRVLDAIKSEIQQLQQDERGDGHVVGNNMSG